MKLGTGKLIRRICVKFKINIYSKLDTIASLIKHRLNFRCKEVYLYMMLLNLETKNMAKKKVNKPNPLNTAKKKKSP